MEIETQDSLDAMIAEEKRLVAEALLLEAWEAGLSDGIESDILAASFSRKILAHLGSLYGAEAAGELLVKLNRMNENGEFVPHKTLQ